MKQLQMYKCSIVMDKVIKCHCHNLLDRWYTSPWAVMYVCVRVIDIASFSVFDIWLWNCSDRFFVWLYKHHGLIFTIQMNGHSFWCCQLYAYERNSTVWLPNVICLLWLHFYFWYKSNTKFCCILKTCVGVCKNSEYSAIITSSTILHHLLINNICYG